MKLLDKLVLKDLLPTFAFSISLFTALYFITIPLMDAAKYFAQGVSMLIILQILILNVPVVLSLTIPMGVVLAVLNGYGRISADSESVAVYAGGIPFARAAAPAIWFGLVASIAGFLVTDYLAAQATHKINEIKDTVIKHIANDHPIILPPFMKDNRLDYTVVIGKSSKQTPGVLQHVTASFFDKEGAPDHVIYARSAKWREGVNYTLKDVTVNYLGDHAAIMKNPELDIRFNVSPNTLNLLDTDNSELTFAQLKKRAKELRDGGFMLEARQSEFSMWRILSMPLASLVFALIASPLGLRPHRTTKVPGAGLAVLLILGYYVLFMTMSSLSDHGTLAPALAAFMPDIIGVVVGGVLIARAAT